MLSQERIMEEQVFGLQIALDPSSLVHLLQIVTDLVIPGWKWELEKEQTDFQNMGVSINGGNPKSSMFIEFSIKNQLFWGCPILWKPHISKSTACGAWPSMGILTVRYINPKETGDSPHLLWTHRTPETERA